MLLCAVIINIGSSEIAILLCRMGGGVVDEGQLYYYVKLLDSIAYYTKPASVGRVGSSTVLNAYNINKCHTLVTYKTASLRVCACTYMHYHNCDIISTLLMFILTTTGSA